MNFTNKLAIGRYQDETLYPTLDGDDFKDDEELDESVELPTLQPGIDIDLDQIMSLQQ